MPINTLFFHFVKPLNRLLRELWKSNSRDPFLEYHLPNAPFLACKNHKTIGRILSHKRRKFHTHPEQLTLRSDAAQNFLFQRFNRPVAHAQKKSGPLRLVKIF